MASTEKQGKHWRGRYLLPRSMWKDPNKPLKGTVSKDEFGRPFTDERDALAAALLKEKEIREEGPAWVDPRKGEIAFKEWAEVLWWRGREFEDTSVKNMQYLLRAHLIPRWGERPLNTIIDPQEVNEWELQIPKMVKEVGKGTYSRRTARDARNFLSLLLGDAVRANRITINAAERERNRGKKAARNIAIQPDEKVWSTPLDALLVAERAALTAGRDDEFWLVVLIAWMGFRWGEAIGARREFIKASSVCGWYRLDHQLKEVDGIFRLASPKDESKRRVDLPRFLDALTEIQVQRMEGIRCTCKGNRCGGKGYLYLTRMGSHPSRSNFSERVWHPAVDGATPEDGGLQPRPQMPVLVDASSGRLLRPAWPYADIEDLAAAYTPPRGGGRPQWDAPYVLGIACQHPDCLAAVGMGCRSASGGKVPPHSVRKREAVELGVYLAPASWTPVKRGLTPHGLRHGHQTWMAEQPALVARKIMKERMGHNKGQLSNMTDHYTHVSDGMREQLLELLERLWWEAVDERIAMDERSGRRPGSRVAMLNAVIQKRLQERVPSRDEARPQKEVGLRTAVPTLSPGRRPRRDRGHLRVV